MPARVQDQAVHQEGTRQRAAETSWPSYGIWLGRRVLCLHLCDRTRWLQHGRWAEADIATSCENDDRAPILALQQSLGNGQLDLVFV